MGGLLLYSRDLPTPVYLSPSDEATSDSHSGNTPHSQRQISGGASVLRKGLRTDARREQLLPQPFAAADFVVGT